MENEERIIDDYDNLINGVMKIISDNFRSPGIKPPAEYRERKRQIKRTAADIVDFIYDELQER